MLSYKHAFHAGNFADVLKHLCWLDIIDYLGKKPKPFSLYDTHSGAGRYALDDAMALKNREFESGIGALGSASFANPLVSRYLALCDNYLSVGQYPGSPLIALDALARDEAVELMELHPSEYSLLKTHTRQWANAHVHHRDGFEGLLALTPPTNKRGAILIDPPYERKEEYTQVVNTTEKVLARWRQAQLIIWYPKLSVRAGDKSGASEQMVSKLATLAPSAFSAELCIAPNNEEVGMYGSGIVVLNAPWQCDERLTAAIEAIMPHLPDDATFSCNQMTRA